MGLGTRLSYVMVLIYLMYELIALVDVHNPDIICIVESWLNADITDVEVAIPRYVSCRADRNRHGGGIIINFTLRAHSSFPFSQNIPVVWNYSQLSYSTIPCLPGSVCLSVCLLQASQFFSEILDYVCDCFDSIDTAQFTNFIANSGRFQHRHVFSLAPLV